jgi:hypothetical protein
MKAKLHKGFIAWRGASQIDGSQIVLLVVRGSKKGANEKTGAMVQTYILRTDVSPLEALKNGADFSICGNCKHGPKNVQRPDGLGSCYVQVQNAPTGIYKAYTRNRYPVLTELEAREQLNGFVVRLGAYGDPSAVPFEVWESLLHGAKAWTGYTHQWKEAHASKHRRYCMASCDTAEEYSEARAQGWRCFYVVPKGFTAKVEKAFLCPASEEGGKKLNCIDCLACDGTHSGRVGSVFIPVHGVAFKQTRFNNLIQIGSN